MGVLNLATKGDYLIMLRIAIVLQAALLVSGIDPVTVDPVVIERDRDVCPSMEHLRNGLHTLRERVETTLGNISTHCGEGLWSRVAYLNMSDPSQQCSSAWKEYNCYSSPGIRPCGRPEARREVVLLQLTPPINCIIKCVVELLAIKLEVQMLLILVKRVLMDTIWMELASLMIHLVTTSGAL